MKLIEKYPIVMIIVGVLGISLSAIFVRLSSAPSVVTAAYRLLFTVLLMSPTVFGSRAVRKELFSADRRTVLLSAVSGILLAIHFGTWFESLRHTTVASSTIIVCTEVIWVALGFCVFLKGKLSLRAILAIGVTLVGSVVIAMADSSGSGNQLYGDVLALVAAVAVGGYTLLGRVVRSSTGTTVYTFIVYVFCSLALVGTAAVQGYGLLGYGWQSVAAGLCLCLFSTILGHSIFSWCLKYFSPTFVSASKLCEPVISGAFAAVLFGEIPGVRQVLGSITVLAGVVYYSLIEMREQKQTA